MAVTSAVVLQTGTTFICDVTWGADGDTDSGAIAHGLAAAPLKASIVPLGAVATVDPGVKIKSIGATTFIATKVITAGGSACVARVCLSAPHSIT